MHIQVQATYNAEHATATMTTASKSVVLLAKVQHQLHDMTINVQAHVAVSGAYLLVRPRLPALVSLGGLNLLALVRAAVQGVYLLVRPRL